MTYVIGGYDPHGNFAIRAEGSTRRAAILAFRKLRRQTAAHTLRVHWYRATAGPEPATMVELEPFADTRRKP
jgi:hypothetical protein